MKTNNFHENLIHQVISREYAKKYGWSTILEGIDSYDILMAAATVYRSFKTFDDAFKFIWHQKFGKVMNDRLWGVYSECQDMLTILSYNIRRHGNDLTLADWAHL